MGLVGEVKTVAYVCEDSCGFGQLGDRDGERTKSGELHPKHREWDGTTTVRLVDGKGECPNCGKKITAAVKSK